MNMDERREHQRIDLHRQCLVNHSGNVGEIIDLSLGGVSCWCVHGHLCSTSSSRKVDIFCKEGQLWVRRLPLKVLSSESVVGKFLGGVPVRRCRGSFADLQEGQREQLENIILSHTMLQSQAEAR